MAPAESSSGFLRIARRDLSAAMAMVDASVFEEDVWGFYLQQATEKALKAWLLVLSPNQPPFSHNLRLLFQMLRDQGAPIDTYTGLSRFTLFAVLRRYDEEPEQVNFDRPLWNQLCAALIEHVDSLLPRDLHAPAD